MNAPLHSAPVWKGTYRVKSIWKTLQGEGFFAGRPAVFVRFVGCNMWSGYESDRVRDAERTGGSCALWCDTDFTREHSRTYNAVELVGDMVRIGGPIRFCVLTGGEPLLQANARLIETLHDAGFQVAVETNGTVALNEAFRTENPRSILSPDWVVCSPKLPEDQLKLEWFDELKLVVPDYQPTGYKHFAHRARIHNIAGHPVPLLWLQPEDGPRQDAAVRQCIDLALAHPTWRVSVQTHKVLNVE